MDKTVKASERALSIANIRYREGYADFQRVLDAQKSMFSQAERQLLNQQAQVASVINLYKSLGGGWSMVSTSELIPENIRQTMQERTNWGALLSAPIYLPEQNPDNTSETIADE